MIKFAPNEPDSYFFQIA